MNMKKRILAVFLAVVLVVGMLPMTTLAEVNSGELKELSATYVAQITGGNSYETLEAAVEAATDGDEIKLLADVTLDGNLTIGKAITITKGEYEIDGGEIEADDDYVLEETDTGWTVTKKLMVRHNH